MSEATSAAGFKPKKSVALSGVTAGNTALCSVGKTGNDLHYRGYDILDVADVCEFEEIAYLIVHGGHDVLGVAQAKAGAGPGPRRGALLCGTSIDQPVSRHRL